MMYPRGEQNSTLDWLIAEVKRLRGIIAKNFSGDRIRSDSGGTGVVGPPVMQEVRSTILLPLLNPLVASANTDAFGGFLYEKPAGFPNHRIREMQIRFSGNVGGDVTIKLQKGGVDIPGAVMTVASGTKVGTRTAFTAEVLLADGDVITAVQTTARTDAQNGIVYIYGTTDTAAAIP